MLAQLSQVEKRYAELQQQLCDPAVLADAERYRQLIKESARLEPVTEQYRRYIELTRQRDEARSLLDSPEMRELLLEDRRFSRAHTFVYDGHPYWESHCFDKDLPAIAKVSDAPLIEEVIRYNEQCKARYGGAGS